MAAIRPLLVLPAAAAMLGPGSAAAATGGFSGADLGLPWILPFVGILLSIALLPLLTPHFWHHHFGKVAAGWALAFLVPFAMQFGAGEAMHQVAHTLLLEYIPFVILLLALFTIAGGILLTGNLHGTPLVNTGMLALGTALASVMGTTGAAMLLIRPLIRANDNRQHNVHVVVFFIFLVGNIGGSLTPLGDPPLFLGFLKGVDFFWTTRAMALPMLGAAIPLLALFFVLDAWLSRKEREGGFVRRVDPTPDSPLRLHGGLNFVLLGGVVGAVLLSGLWKPGIAFMVLGSEVELQNVLRDVLLLALAAASWRLTAREVREGNAFTWGPILEVAKLFAGIFITIIPAIAILRAGEDGALSGLVALVNTADGRPIDAWYFWLTGALSSFLDNAPTYLVFFNLAGGEAPQLMGPLASTLLAISCGSVFMGANTYIGNAPNFMIKAIAEERGVKMPSFFGYMIWSTVILIPLFVLLSLIFFRG